MEKQAAQCELAVGKAMNVAMAGSRLRILIVGSGIAGATLAALLLQRGEKPVVIERGAPDAAEGYLLGLYPLGGRVLHGLRLYDRYRKISCRMRRYILHGIDGAPINEFAMDEFSGRYGEIRGVDRGLLIELLRSATPAENIFYHTEIVQLQNSSEGVVATFSDGSAQEFDIVVGADGIHSRTRSQILSPSDYSYKETDWGGWGMWASIEGLETDTYRELWAQGWGVGIYPVLDKLGVFVGASSAMRKAHSYGSLVEMMVSKLPEGALRGALERVQSVEDPFFWKLEDCRTKKWFVHRVMLLGDAAAAFLPTAGIGASMAMDSAAALADELTRTDVEHLEYAYSLYEKRQRSRVEKAQANSRLLATLILQNTALGSRVRDIALKHYSLQGLLKNIRKVMEGG